MRLLSPSHLEIFHNTYVIVYYLAWSLDTVSCLAKDMKTFKPSTSLSLPSPHPVKNLLCPFHKAPGFFHGHSWGKNPESSSLNYTPWSSCTREIRIPTNYLMLSMQTRYLGGQKICIFYRPTSSSKNHSYGRPRAARHDSIGCIGDTADSTGH